MADTRIAVERIVNDALAKVLEAISREHGVRVDSLAVEWTETVRLKDVKPTCSVKYITMRTTAYGPWSEENL